MSWAQLAVQGAKFWVADLSRPKHLNYSPESLNGMHRAPWSWVVGLIAVSGPTRRLLAGRREAGPGRCA
jgi:hypothetical protein